MASHSLVITSEPARHLLTPALARRATSGLPQEWNPGEPVWLGPGEALEVPFGPEVFDTDVAAILSDLRTACEDLPIDINVVKAGPARRKSILIADMDSTIIQQECIDEIAAHAGIGERVAGITERAMRGELDFEAALTERVGLLAGLEETALQTVYDTRIALTPGARVLIQTMAANGSHCALVSGGFTFFTRRIAQQVGFHENKANRLECIDGKLTGRVVAPILGQEAKLQSLLQMCSARSLSTSDALAVGDGANDLAMIREAGLGVAFRAKPIVAAEARAAIAHGDLTALLYLQGYSRSEFVDGPS